MDHRVVIAAVVALTLVAFGGIFYVLSPRSDEAEMLSARTTAVTPPPPSSAPTPKKPQAAPPVPDAAAGPSRVSVASLEAEIASSDHAALQVLLKKSFPDEYKELMEFAAQRRNEGVPEAAAGQELLSRLQEMMRPKLKFAAMAAMPLIDKLADNEVELFHALGTEGASYCLKVLGKDATPSPGPVPVSIQRMMRLGTLYRFEAIIDGMPQNKPIEALKPEEMSAFEAGLTGNGLKLDEVQSGAFINMEGAEPGKPCLMIEQLYRTIAALDDGARRKLYAGMFFLGRDK